MSLYSVFTPSLITFWRLVGLYCTATVILYSCSAAQRSLSITLDETPLYPNKQWAVVNIPYIKVYETLGYSRNSTLLGTLPLGNIVVIQRVESEHQGSTIWAYVISGDTAHTDGFSRLSQSKQAPQNQYTANSTALLSIRGWVPYDFLHMVGNFKEAQLTSQQILKTISQKNLVGSPANLPSTGYSESSQTYLP